MRSEPSWLRELATTRTDLMAFRATVLRRAAKTIDARFGPVWVTDPETGDRVNLCRWLATVYPSMYMPYDYGEEVNAPLSREDSLRFGQSLRQMRERPMFRRKVARLAEPESPQEPPERSQKVYAPQGIVHPENEAQKGHQCPSCMKPTAYQPFSGGREFYCPHCGDSGIYPEGFRSRATLLRTPQGRQTLRTEMREELRRRRDGKE